jgi:hypothetical protein
MGGRMWKQILKRGNRVFVDGKETRTILFEGVELEIKEEKKGNDNGMFHIRLKRKEKPVWEE